MSTTTLIVEMLIAGAMADIWIGLVLFRFYPFLFTTSSAAISDLKELLIVPFIALTYGFGIAINSAAEKLTKGHWDKKYRDPIFSQTLATHKMAKPGDVISQVFHKGSKDVVDSLRTNLHLIRASRSSSLNFLLIAVAILLYEPTFGIVATVAFAFLILVSGLVYLEGLSRYKENHTRTVREFNVLKDEEKIRKSSLSNKVASKSKGG